METSPKLDTKLLAVIKGIGHPDRLVSHASLNEINDILDSPEKQAVLRDYDEIYIQSVLEQFKVRLSNEITNQFVNSFLSSISTCRSARYLKQQLSISLYSAVS